MTNAALTDAELLGARMRGDEAAFTELYVRHQPAARRLARTLRRPATPTTSSTGRSSGSCGAAQGHGPTDAFRAYLFVTLRRLRPTASPGRATSRSTRCPSRAAPRPTAELDAGRPGPDRRRLRVAARPLAGGAVAHRRRGPCPARARPHAGHVGQRRGRPGLPGPREAAPGLPPGPPADLARGPSASPTARGSAPTCATASAPATAGHRGSPRRLLVVPGLVAELADVNRLLVRSLFPIFVGVGEVARRSPRRRPPSRRPPAAQPAPAPATRPRGATDLGRSTSSKARSQPGCDQRARRRAAGRRGHRRCADRGPGRPDGAARVPTRRDEAAPAGPAPPDDGPEVPLEIAAATTGRTDQLVVRAAPDVLLGRRPRVPERRRSCRRHPRRRRRRRRPRPGRRHRHHHRRRRTRPAPHRRREVPPTSPPSQGPPPSPPPQVPPTTRPAPPQPPTAQPCQVHVQIGGILDIVLCLDPSLLDLLDRQSGGRGLKFSQ